MSDAEARDDLRRLMDSGVKLSRLTVLTVVCEHGRTLAKVYRVNGRDVLDVHLKPMRATVGSNHSGICNPQRLTTRPDVVATTSGLRSNS